MIDIKINKLIKQKAKDYGNPEDYMQTLADVWGAMLGIKLSPNQVVAMYIASKSLRAFNNPGHFDSFLDVTGYGKIGCDLIKNKKKR